MNDPTEAILTPEEVADFLRSDTATVVQMLERGTLSGFRVGGEWRVLALAVVEYMKSAMKKEQDAALERGILDPRSWVEVIRSIPDEAKTYEEREFPEGSFGAWIKDALRSDDHERARREQEQGAGNVVPLDPRRDPPS